MRFPNRTETLAQYDFGCGGLGRLEPLTTSEAKRASVSSINRDHSVINRRCDAWKRRFGNPRWAQYYLALRFRQGNGTSVASLTERHRRRLSGQVDVHDEYVTHALTATAKWIVIRRQ